MSKNFGIKMLNLPIIDEIKELKPENVYDYIMGQLVDLDIPPSTTNNYFSYFVYSSNKCYDYEQRYKGMSYKFNLYTKTDISFHWEITDFLSNKEITDDLLLLITICENDIQLQRLDLIYEKSGNVERCLNSVFMVVENLAQQSIEEITDGRYTYFTKIVGTDKDL